MFSRALKVVHYLGLVFRLTVAMRNALQLEQRMSVQVFPARVPARTPPESQIERLVLHVKQQICHACDCVRISSAKRLGRRKVINF